MIQDHIVAGFHLTLRDTILSREQYQQLVYAAIKDNYDGRRISLLPPCYLRPQRLWSGKQVITTVLQNITAGFVGLNLDFNAKISNEWSKGYEDLEGEGRVIFRNGELLNGVMDKNQCGATTFGLVHSCHELYGGRIASEILSAMGRLFTEFLKIRCISFGVDDILVTPPANQARTRLLQKTSTASLTAAADFLEIPPADFAQLSLAGQQRLVRAGLETTLRDPELHKSLDSFMMGIYIYIGFQYIYVYKERRIK